MNFEVTPQEFAVVWAALLELPAKHSYSMLVKLRAQVEAQEAQALQEKKNADERTVQFAGEAPDASAH